VTSVEDKSGNDWKGSSAGMKNVDLVVLGEVALDVILSGVNKIPRRWSEVGKVRAAGIFAAGSAGYVAQCFSKLEGRAAIVGRIGDDSLGKIVIEGFRECGVSTNNLVADEAFQTEVSTVIVYNDGNKSSAVSEVPPLRLDKLDPRCLHGAKALHIGAYLMLPDLWGRSTIHWIKRAKREGISVSLDPQMSATGEWGRAFEGVLEHLDLLLLDEVEARKISRKKRTLNAVEHLLGQGVSTVAVKAGKKGCIIGECGRICSAEAFRTRPVSTIGAGDAFDAAFIYGSMRGWPLMKIARFSNIVAALSMTKLGCMTAIPKAKDAEKIVKAQYGDG
jgi:sugar/nucleoside kinase (ribokinase family)